MLCSQHYLSITGGANYTDVQVNRGSGFFSFDGDYGYFTGLDYDYGLDSRWQLGMDVLYSVEQAHQFNVINPDNTVTQFRYLRVAPHVGFDLFRGLVLTTGPEIGFDLGTRINDESTDAGWIDISDQYRTWLGGNVSLQVPITDYLLVISRYRFGLNNISTDVVQFTDDQGIPFDPKISSWGLQLGLAYRFEL